MRDRKHLLDQLDAHVLVISFEEPAVLRRFHWFRTLPFTVASDPTRSLYRAFGLSARSVLHLLDRATIGVYLRALIRGHLPHLRRADFSQLGGDIVLDRTGEVIFSYRSETPADRPHVDLLLQVLRDARH